MRLTVIASGSRGNCALLEIGNARLLLDCGISCKRIKTALQPMGLTPDDLDGILITHEHTDHTTGLKTLLGHHHIPVYTRPKTMAAIGRTVPNIGDTFNPLFDRITVKDVTVEAFSPSHDAADSIGFSVTCGEKFSLATDLGIMTDHVLANIIDADVLLLEANHDRQLLQRGSYPPPLKKRILSALGHLDNRTAGETLCRLTKRPEHVILGHISEENNRPLLARQTVEAVISEAGMLPSSFNITVLDQGDGTVVSI